MKLLNKYILGAITALAVITGAKAQEAYKPTIMVFPDVAWCQQNNYCDANGNVSYEKALMDKDMRGAIGAIQDMMAAQGYQLMDLEQMLNDLKSEGAYDMVLTSKGDGEIVEDDLDRLTRTASADIMVSLAVNKVPYGPRTKASIDLKSIDAASKKTIQFLQSPSVASGADSVTSVQQAMNESFTNFLSRTDLHFATTAAKGREGSLTFKIASDCPLRMDSEITIDGETGELTDYLEYWLSENCQGGSFSPGRKSKVSNQYLQVRIPLFGTAKKGGFGSRSGKRRAQSAESFVKPIADKLAASGLSVSVTPIGVGSAIVVIGGR